MSRAFKKLFGFGAWYKGQDLVRIMHDKGIAEYNKARAKNPNWHPDFSGASLQGLDLTTANIRAANMVNANLDGVTIDNFEFNDERARPRLAKRGAIVE
jgi:uncharacterized protein YjbI with pentapeptide repeats